MNIILIILKGIVKFVVVIVISVLSFPLTLVFLFYKLGGGKSWWLADDIIEPILRW